MNIINVLDYGVKNDGTPTQAELSRLIASTDNDTELLFPKGRYYLERAVYAGGKNNLVLHGEDAVILTHFTPWNDPSENNNAFDFRDSDNILIENLTFTTDNPTSCAGRVTAKDEEAHTYDVKIDDEFPITGWEHFWGTDTTDEEGTPDYVIETYDRIIKETVTDEAGNERIKLTGTKYTCLGNNTVRIQMPENWNLHNLTIGHRVLYRYLIYGSTVFSFAGCHNVTLKNIEIERCTSMGAVISPRCSNFTFDNFNIRTPGNSNALYAANADGIHIIGLEGYLHMKDCTFTGLGDDALNIHSTAGEIANFDEEKGSIECIYRNRDMSVGKLSELWAQDGDMLRVYDRETFLEKGTVTIDSYRHGIAHIKSLTGTLAVGDILANDSFFASVHIENCEVRHTRARGFLLQSRNVLVENCRIYGMSLPGIIVSPDIKVWYEVGPSDNVEIRDCTFEKCSINGSSANLGAIVVKASHDTDTGNYPAGVHTNMRIHHNTFKNCGNSGVFVSATSGIEVYNNNFVNCSMKLFSNNVDRIKYDIALKNCSDISVYDNISDKPKELLLHTDGCEMK